MKKVRIFISIIKFISFIFCPIGLELQKRQSAPQNADVLPTLSITDIDKKVVRVPIIEGQTGIYLISDIFSLYSIVSGNTYVQLCEQPTNGITYFRCLLNTFDLPNELKPYLPLFVNILTK
jgi:Zn-dependent M16 (insulinase) family peptidase